MATNILSLPLVQVAFTTATNESWRDGVQFATAGSAVSTATAGNTGNGQVAGLSVAQGAYIGVYTLTMTSASQYQVTDPDGYLIGSGAVGAVFSASGLFLTLNAGSVPFATGDSFAVTVLPQPLDITGIRFAMMMRSDASETSARILVSADTNLGTLINGGQSGVLGINIAMSVMAGIPVSADGSPYPLDIVAIADGDQRRCVTGTNAVVTGITTPAS